MGDCFCAIGAMGKIDMRYSQGLEAVVVYLYLLGEEEDLIYLANTGFDFALQIVSSFLDTVTRRRGIAGHVFSL